MSNYKGLFTFDEDSHKYVPIAGAEGIIDAIGHKPAEPLIKDEKIRKAIRVWARLNVVKEVTFDEYWHSFRDMDMVISFLFSFRDFDCLEDGKTYTIAELCGEEEE